MIRQLVMKTFALHGENSQGQTIGNNYGYTSMPSFYNIQNITFANNLCLIKYHMIRFLKYFTTTDIFRETQSNSVNSSPNLYSNETPQVFSTYKECTDILSAEITTKCHLGHPDDNKPHILCGAFMSRNLIINSVYFFL